MRFDIRHVRLENTESMLLPGVPTTELEDDDYLYHRQPKSTLIPGSSLPMVDRLKSTGVD
ncbi:hypothetical protein [Shewanella sp. YLB-07]|uniref:hypothetical protein n=1 Tax=Shewanella sp. YLB-07 TaxID=2601268 RepID=UPI00128B36B6|nr:hypothetical protein [Shewanella sp. YLB-07]MPY24566.1 hypothetical protein [Shewanella sp. YLB-07]